MLQDQINRIARMCRVSVSVRELTQGDGIVSIGVRGRVDAVSRAFFSRYFCGQKIYVYEV